MDRKRMETRSGRGRFSNAFVYGLVVSHAAFYVEPSEDP